MKAVIYAERIPTDRCAILGKSISTVALLSESECLWLAKEFYCGFHDVSDPVTFELRPDAMLSGFEDICRINNLHVEYISHESAEG